MAALTITDKTAAMGEALKRLTRVNILVGVPAINATRKAADPTLSEEEKAAESPGSVTPSAPAEPITNAAIAYIAENGSPARNIPPRPFMRQGIALAHVAITKQFQKAGRAAMIGDLDEMNKAFNAAGLIAASGMKTAIQEGNFVALAQRTLDARMARGRSGTKPLLDTGQLRNAVTYVLQQIGSK